TAMQELINWLAVAIGGVKVAKRVEAKSERIDLAPGVLLDARTIEANAVSVAGIHFHLVTVGAAHIRVVVVAVRGVEPAVEATTKRTVHTVRIPFPTERAVELLLFVRFAVAIGVFEQPDIWNGPDDTFPGDFGFRISDFGFRKGRCGAKGINT